MMSAAVTTVRPTIANPENKKTKKSAVKPKTAKKAVGKKNLKAELEARGRKQDAMQIVPLIKDNPCGEGTFCWAQVQAVLTSKTVAEAKQRLTADPKNPTRNRKMEVGWMVRSGYIKLQEA